MMASSASINAPVQVELPVGYVDRSGRVHRHASLKKMTGHEEALVYETGGNPGKLVTGLLTACLVQLGDLEVVDHELITDLYLADRNFMVLRLRQITLGDRLVGRYRCPRCEAAVRVVEDLSELPIRAADAEARNAEKTVELQDGYRDPDGRVHRLIRLRPPTGNDEETVGLLAMRDPLRARDALVLRCILEFGGIKPAVLSGMGVEILRSLSLGDRYILVEALNELTLGPDFRRIIECQACGTDFNVLLDASSFFDMGWVAL